MQACYVNTTHPDFLNGHKVWLQRFVMVQVEADGSNGQAMAMVSDKLNANKPPPTTEKGKITSGQLNNNKDLDVDAKKEEPGFFGSFWSQKSGGKPKKVGAASMESVSWPGITCCWELSCTVLTTGSSHRRLSSRNLR